MSPSLGIVISQILGWSYTLAWTTSFFPQILLNYRRRSVQGLSFDFLVLNVFGFACYSIFNATMLGSAEIREEYRRRNGGHSPAVHVNDLMFSLLAATCASVTGIQAFVYKRDEDQRISSFARTFLIGGITAIVSSLFLSSWLDTVYLLSYLKLGVSATKYIPQALLNYQRQSTEGWSIVNIILDFSGGSLALAQLVLDGWLADDLPAILANPGKLGLSLLSLGFDALFFFQHFMLYRNSPPAPLVDDGINAIAALRVDESSRLLEEQA